MQHYLCALLTFPICFLLALGPRPAPAKIVERILTIVNDEIITLTDREDYERKLKSGALNDDLVVSLVDRKEVLQSPNKLLDLMIDDRILDSEIKREGLEVSSERVEQEMRNIMKRNNLTREQLKAAIQRQGLDFAEYQDQLKRSLERQSLIQKVITSQVKISDEEVAAYYLTNNKAPTSSIFEYTLAHILFDPQKGGAKAAESRAQTVYGKIKEGLRFEDAAVQFTEDRNFTAGGLLGTFKSGEFVPEMETAVKSLQPGEYSKIVKTKQGYHIVQLIKRGLVADPRFEKERARIQNILFAEAFKRQFKNWLEQRRQAAFIRKNI